MENMTVLSSERFECAMQITNTGEAAEALMNYRHFRTLGDVLRAYSDSDQIKKQLVEGLLQWAPQSNGEAVDRKVRNWLAGRTQSIGKEDAFILSHILGLDLDKTNEFLKKTVGEGIHWRDPEDIVWCYALVHRLTPSGTEALLEKAREICKATDGRIPAVSGGYTAQVHQKLQSVLHRSEEELLEFLEQERGNLGTFHNTAYQIFMQYLLLLEQGFSDQDVETLFREMTQKEKKKKEADAADRKETARKEAQAAGIPFSGDDPGRRMTVADLDGDTELYQPETLSSRDILETYLYRSLVPAREEKGKKTKDPFHAIRRSIRQSWPDEFTLSKMRNRQTDVTRKVLILLFLATDGSNSEYEELYEEEEMYSREDMFQDIYTRLNLMLNSCGFLGLDPRSPFDWMVLYCISSGDLWQSDERIQDMLVEMFPQEDP